jgi:hypothetical protein
VEKYFSMQVLCWPVRHFRRLIPAALAVPVVVLGTVATHSSKDGIHRDWTLATIAEGAVCKSLSDGRYEVSCGTTAFGDVRFNCTAGHLGKCPRTTAVTLRNVSRTPVTVTLVSGRREGDRRLSPAPELLPGRTVVLRPRHDERYLFDILVRSMRPGVGMVKVLAVD